MRGVLEVKRYGLITLKNKEDDLSGFKFAANGSPRYTAMGIRAEESPAANGTRRIAAESVSPQLIAVLRTDTELRFAVIPVIILSSLICGYKGI